MTAFFKGFKSVPPSQSFLKFRRDSLKQKIQTDCRKIKFFNFSAVGVQLSVKKFDFSLQLAVQMDTIHILKL